MDKKGLIIGIDYTSEYCQACFYNAKHRRCESISASTGVMRYLVPTALCYSNDAEDWLIGDEAIQYAEMSGAYLFDDLLANLLIGEKCYINDKEYSYVQLLAVYFGKLLELIELKASVMGIENITINLQKVNMEIKSAMDKVFTILGLDLDRLRLVSKAESFAYFVLNESSDLWKDGAVLFDFGPEGFFIKQLTVAGAGKEKHIYVNEKNYSLELSVLDLASEMNRRQLDDKLGDIYDEVKLDGENWCVYFTGEGFSELWFKDTLETISETNRSFKGNNIYVMGACLAGYRRAYEPGNDYKIICKGRTKADITAEVRYDGRLGELTLSPAACDWYDAGSITDFILDKKENISFYITSLVGRERTAVEFDLSKFPDRPGKCTRVEVEVRYINDFECEITVTDKGFGAFFASTGVSVSKRLNLEGYI